MAASSAEMAPPFRKVALAQPSTGEEEWQALRAPLETGWLTQGPQVAAFEKAFAARHCVEHALAVSSATAGLHLALAALGIGPGDEVIVPSFTWVATANAVVYCGAVPVFADVDPKTFNIDPGDLKGRITARTKAIVAVHLFGLSAEMGTLRKVVPPGIPIIEDAACAAGAQFRNRPVGSLGNVAVFSFHPRKSITTGEGGMVTTDDPEIARRIEALRSHGATPSEDMVRLGPRPHLMADFDVLGFNYRMSDLQAALGRVQLGKLDRFIDERAEGARRYAAELCDLPWLRLPREPRSGRHAWQSFVVSVLADKAPRPRDDIMNFLSGRGIQTRPGTHAVHMLGYYRRRFGLSADSYPGAREADRQSIAIPLHNCMTPEDYEHVIAALRSL